jgi:hypothetical protein
MLTRMRARGSLIKGQHAPTRVVRRLTHCPRSSDGRYWQRNLSTEHPTKFGGDLSANLLVWPENWLADVAFELPVVRSDS